MPQRRGEVARADEQTIDAFNRCNRLEILQRGSRLNLNAHADFVSATFVIILHSAIAVGAMSDGYATDALRWIARGSHGCAPFLRRLHIWNQQILDTDIEQALHDHRIVPRRSDHRRRSPADQALQLTEHNRQFVGRVLGIDEDPVEARPGNHLRANVAAKTAPEPDLRPAFAQGLLKRIWGQLHVHDEPAPAGPWLWVKRLATSSPESFRASSRLSFSHYPRNRFFLLRISPLG